jgi:hypothetical protein
MVFIFNSYQIFEMKGLAGQPAQDSQDRTARKESQKRTNL